jgi:hypothetical protein
VMLAETDMLCVEMKLAWLTVVCGNEVCMTYGCVCK